jgi:TolA-binding protein
MRRTGAWAAMITAALLLAPSAASANREQQQLMAELRMLQQNQQQMQQMVLQLTDALKAVTDRLEEQSATSRKALADQRLLIEGMTDTVRVLRERSDDTNVRLSSFAQELESIRLTIAAIPQSMGSAAPAAGDPGADPTAGDGLFGPGAQAAGQVTVPPPNVSPQRTWDTAYSDYAGGQYDLAIEGFETFLRFFPRHIDADNAQVHIGNAHFNAGRYKEALSAYQRVIADYPGTDSVPQAYFKLGSTYMQLKQPDAARKAWQTILQDFDASVPEYMLARQAIERLK